MAYNRAGDGESGRRQAHGKFLRLRRRTRPARPSSASRAAWREFQRRRAGKNHAAAVDDVEDGDGLARLALVVERIAAEIYEIERDSTISRMAMRSAARR